MPSKEGKDSLFSRSFGIFRTLFQTQRYAWYGLTDAFAIGGAQAWYLHRAYQVRLIQGNRDLVSESAFSAAQRPKPLHSRFRWPVCFGQLHGEHCQLWRAVSSQ